VRSGEYSKAVDKKMKKHLVLASTVLLLSSILIFSLASSAQALPFTFSGSDAGGTAFATLNFEGMGTNTWTITIDNTSPTLLDGSSDPNAPAITGIGFDIDPVWGVLSWELSALDSNNNSVSIPNWKVKETGRVGSYHLDILATNPKGSKSGLYNPEAIEPFGAPPQYFTTATLNIVFGGDTDLVVSGNPSPFARWQNVGEDGDGSLKTFGASPVPEPATIILLGAGLVGLAGFNFKRRFKR